ncbi:MAG: sugar ABC transporter permease [Clostridia bacterium]|nr:sugar ABC transporter permease [Clostridia bacterium]
MKRGGAELKKDLKSKRKGITREDLSYYAVMAPFLIFFFVFNILPVLASMALSFFDYDMVSKPIFTGLENYSRMFSGDSVFLTVLGNTLRFSIVAGPISFLLAFLLAWMINEFSRTVRVILTFIFYAPALVGNAYFIWQVFFSGDSYGYLNNFLISFGFITEPINWFQNTSYNMTIIIIVQLWMSMGVSFLANIAGLQNVSTELYEAAAIDGVRTRWHELWYVTLPSMKSILLFSSVMQIQAVFSVSAVITTLAGYPSVNNSVDVLVSYISDIGTARYEMGYASALSIFLFLMVLAFRFGIGALLNLVGKSDS